MFNWVTKRRTLIVDKQMQLQPVRSILTQGVLLGVGFLITVYFVGQKFSKFFETFVAGDDAASTNFFREVNFILLAYFGYTFIVMVVTSYLSVVFTNKIAGPVFNMMRVLDKNEREGTFDMIRLRKDDLLHKLADKINVLIEKSRSSTTPNSKTENT